MAVLGMGAFARISEDHAEIEIHAHRLRGTRARLGRALMLRSLLDEAKGLQGYPG